jgi:CBS domain-containing protein
MKVRDLMTVDVISCRPDTSLAEAASLMWERDCGALPVVSPEGRVIGMITDRDMCMAVATRGRPADHISVREVISGALFACLPEDDMRTALETLTTHQIRRLPVVDADGRLKGILSMNDVALHAGRKAGEVPPDELIATLRGICEHRSRRPIPAGV